MRECRYCKKEIVKEKKEKNYLFIKRNFCNKYCRVKFLNLNMKIKKVYPGFFKKENDHDIETEGFSVERILKNPKPPKSIILNEFEALLSVMKINERKQIRYLGIPYVIEKDGNKSFKFINHF